VKSLLTSAPVRPKVPELICTCSGHLQELDVVALPHMLSLALGMRHAGCVPVCLLCVFHAAWCPVLTLCCVALCCIVFCCAARCAQPTGSLETRPLWLTLRRAWSTLSQPIR
jgi:hypothetical protein